MKKVFTIYTIEEIINNPVRFTDKETTKKLNREFKAMKKEQKHGKLFINVELTSEWKNYATINTKYQTVIDEIVYQTGTNNFLVY